MQFPRLPKISLNFRKVFDEKPIKRILDSNIKFADLIPDKISKKVARINSAQVKENACNINLRDGNVIKITNLLSQKEYVKADKAATSELNSETITPHSLRKLRIESSIQAEIINFLSSSHTPKILRTDYFLWFIDSVNLAFSH